MPQTEGCGAITDPRTRRQPALKGNRLKAPCDRADAVRLSGQVAILMILLSVMAPAAGAQDVFMYPARGQSQQQQDRDRYECHSWAVAQTGFDPSRASAAPAPPPPPPPPPQEAPQGGLLRGGARGAAVGAVGGAIGGDAGKGAAIGAATGAMIGGIRRREQMQRQAQQQSSYQQQAAAQANQGSANAAQRDKYNRAMTACLQGRGYTVN
jgi:hypothetical protein